MRKTVITFSLLLFSFAAIRGDKERIAIVTASELGTYAEMAVNLKEVCTNLDFELFTSSGSADNVAQMLDNSQGIHFGIAQIDVLYLLNNFDENNKLNMRKVQMVFPLYDEEIHIVVRKDSAINGIEDLKAKKVNVGLVNSGTQMTAILIQKLTRVKFQEVNLAPEAALKALVAGQVDAMIYVIGQPAPLFLEEEKEEPVVAAAETATETTGSEVTVSTTKTGIDETSTTAVAETEVVEKQPTLLQQVRLVKLRHSKLNKLYSETTIPAGTYEWQSSAVETYKITSVLITSTLTPDRKVQKLTRCALDNMTKLRQEHHEKWKEINPKNYKDLNWPMSEAAVKEIEK